MNIYENMRNKRKMVEKLTFTHKITSTPAANYLILQNLVPNKSWDKVIWLKQLNIRII